MNPQVTAEVFSFLDINEFQLCTGEVPILEGLCSQILTHWLRNTNYTCESCKESCNIRRLRNELLHSISDLPSSENEDHKEWMKQGKLHRKMGPAKESSGAKWLIRDREDLFAIKFIPIKFIHLSWWKMGTFVREEWMSVPD